MISGREVIKAAKELVENNVLTIHFDNINAATIFKKGSTKFRLHRYMHWKWMT